MRVVVVGAGGVGCLLGGLLTRSGVEVEFLARGARLAALQEHGLRVDSPRGEFHVPLVQASDDPAALAPGDVVLVAVKGWQVAEVAPRLQPLLAPGGFAIPLQNGVDAADVLARALGPDHVVGGLCHMFAWIEPPAVVKHQGALLRVTIGERGGASSERVERLARGLREARVDVTVSSDVEAAVWEKFLFIAAFSGVGAVTRAPVGVVRALPESRALLVSAMEEIAALARARRVKLAPEAVARALSLVDGLPAGATASMQRDLQAGHPSELFDQSGAVIRMAREAGVTVPTHELLFGALLPQERAARERA